MVRYVDYPYIRINCSAFLNYKYLCSILRDLYSVDLTWVLGIIFLKT